MPWRNGSQWEILLLLAIVQWRVIFSINLILLSVICCDGPLKYRHDDVRNTGAVGLSNESRSVTLWMDIPQLSSALFFCIKWYQSFSSTYPSFLGFVFRVAEIRYLRSSLSIPEGYIYYWITSSSPSDSTSASHHLDCINYSKPYTRF